MQYNTTFLHKFRKSHSYVFKVFLETKIKIQIAFIAVLIYGLAIKTLSNIIFWEINLQNSKIMMLS